MSQRLAPLGLSIAGPREGAQTPPLPLDPIPLKPPRKEPQPVHYPSGSFFNEKMLHRSQILLDNDLLKVQLGGSRSTTGGPTATGKLEKDQST